MPSALSFLAWFSNEAAAQFPLPLCLSAVNGHPLCVLSAAAAALARQLNSSKTDLAAWRFRKLVATKWGLVQRCLNGRAPQYGIVTFYVLALNSGV